MLDFDLSILGSDWETYQKYAQNIRKEYNVYSYFMYKKGRRKVLQHFLERERLFFTEYSFNAFEEKARFNLKKEMAMW